MLNYKLSDREKFNAIWSLLNPGFNQENDWYIGFDICDIYDEYAVVKNYEEGIFERVYYSKNDETDSLEITARERCYFVDITEAEKKALDALHGLNNNTYEKVDEIYSAALAEVETKTEELTTLTETYTTETAQLNEKIGEFETKIEELNGTISTLTTEREEAVSQLEENQITINSLNEEIQTLNSFKKDVETKEKESVLSKYAELLTEATILEYTTKLDDYADAKELDKELAYVLVSTNQSVFSANPNPGLIPKDEPLTGIAEILNKYKK